MPEDTVVDAAWIPFTQAVITVPSEAGEHEFNWIGRGVAVGIDVDEGTVVGMEGYKSVLVAKGAVEVLKAPPVIVVNVVGVGERTGISLVGVGDGMGVAANSA